MNNTTERKEIVHIRKSNPYAYMLESKGMHDGLCGRTVKWTFSMNQAGGLANIEAAMKDQTMCRNCWKSAYKIAQRSSVFA